MPDIRMRKSIIIGLGGSGNAAANYLKKTLIQFYDKIPYSIKFLCLDTDSRRPMPLKVSVQGKKFEKVDIEPSEFLALTVEDPLRVIEISSEIKKWWPGNIPTKAIHIGAGGYRALGRLAFHAHAHEIQNRIKTILDEINQVDLAFKMKKEQGMDLIGESIDVYIISSLAGGTGSGSFIDTGFLFREALQGYTHRIVGFLILPSAFSGLPATSRVEMNGYAALKELDYYMDFDYRRNKQTFKFGNTECSSSQPPFDIINLIDTHLEKGGTIPAEGPKKIDVLTRIIGEGIALNLGNVGQALDSQLDNLYAHIAAELTNVKDWGGKKPHYSSIGVSSLIYPMEKHFNQISTFYSYKLIEQLTSQLEDGASAKDELDIQKTVEDFLTGKNLTKSGLQETIQQTSNLSIYLSSEGLSTEDELDSEKEVGNRRKEEILNEINNAYLRELEQAKSSINNFLKETEERYGISFARKTCEKLIARINVFNSELLENINNNESQIPIKEQSARDFFASRVQNISIKDKILKKVKGIFQDYLDLISELYRLQLTVARDKKVSLIFTELISQINNYLGSLDLDKIERKLSQVRQEIEMEYFSTSIMLDQYGQHSLIIYSKEMFVPAKDHSTTFLDKEIINLRTDFAKMNILPPEMNEFLTNYNLNLQKFENIDNKELKDLIMDYTHKKVHSILSVNLEKILEYSDEGIDSWIKELSKRAVPLWNHDITGNLAAHQEELFIIGVQDEKNSKLSKYDGNFFDSQYTPYLMSTKDPFKIFMFKYKAPAPAYLLKGLKKYRAIYHNATIEGTPHAQMDFELIATDLFPENENRKFILKLFTVMKALDIIKYNHLLETYIIEDQRCLLPGEDYIELGNNLWDVFEELNSDAKVELVYKLTEIEKEQLSKFQEDSKVALNNYYNYIKKSFDKRSPSMTLGEEILLFKQIQLIDTYKKENNLNIFLQGR